MCDAFSTRLFWSIMDSGMVPIYNSFSSLYKPWIYASHYSFKNFKGQLFLSFVLYGHWVEATTEKKTGVIY